jgi:hypothetical protein
MKIQTNLAKLDITASARITCSDRVSVPRMPILCFHLKFLLWSCLACWNAFVSESRGQTMYCQQTSNASREPQSTEHGSLLVNFPCSGLV